MSANEFDKIRMEQNRMQPNNTQHATRARAVFETSVAHIDADTRRRLRDARDHALRTAAKQQRPAWALPLGAALTAAVALVLFWPHAPVKTPAIVNPRTATAIATAENPARRSVVAFEDSSVDSTLADGLIGDGSDGADPELLGNLDFYDWLARQPALARQGG